MKIIGTEVVRFLSPPRWHTRISENSSAGNRLCYHIQSLCARRGGWKKRISKIRRQVTESKNNTIFSSPHIGTRGFHITLNCDMFWSPLRGILVCQAGAVKNSIPKIRHRSKIGLAFQPPPRWYTRISQNTRKLENHCFLLGFFGIPCEKQWFWKGFDRKSL